MTRLRTSITGSSAIWGFRWGRRIRRRRIGVRLGRLRINQVAQFVVADREPREPPDEAARAGLANDELGYIIPKSEWDEAPPYLYDAKSSPYGEIVSPGPETGPILHAAVPRLIDQAAASSPLPEALTFSAPLPGQPDPAVARAEEVVVRVQVNGKLRARLTVVADVGEEDLRAAALAEPAVQTHIAGKTVARVVVVQCKLVNIVVR